MIYNRFNKSYMVVLGFSDSCIDLQYTGSGTTGSISIEAFNSYIRNGCFEIVPNEI